MTLHFMLTPKSGSRLLTGAVDRGGLFVVRDGTFELFKAIEVKTKEVLPQHLSSCEQAATREELLHCM